MDVGEKNIYFFSPKYPQPQQHKHLVVHVSFIGERNPKDETALGINPKTDALRVNKPKTDATWVNKKVI